MNQSKLPKIIAIRIRPVCVTMPVPHRTASGVVSESPLVLTDVTTDTGCVGHSIVFTYTKAALKPTAEFMRNLEALVVGHPLAPRTISLELENKFRLLGTQGLVGMALAGIDMALWDALAKSHNRSLVHLMGGVAKPISVYAGVGFDGVAGSAAQAEEWAKRGFKGVKAKIGYDTVAQDLEVIRAMRKAVGPDMAIMVDYNQCLQPQQAVERIQHLEDEDLTWVEEPTLAHDYAGHAQIADAVTTPIQCGENWWGVMDMQHAIDAAASDYIMLDVMKVGGVSGWLRGAALTRDRGLQVSSHLWPEVSAQLLTLTPTAHWLEYADWWNPILAEPIPVNEGVIVHAGELGTGISWNESAIEKYAV